MTRVTLKKCWIISVTFVNHYNSSSFQKELISQVGCICHLLGECSTWKFFVVRGHALQKFKAGARQDWVLMDSRNYSWWSYLLIHLRGTNVVPLRGFASLSEITITFQSIWWLKWLDIGQYCMYIVLAKVGLKTWNKSLVCSHFPYYWGKQCKIIPDLWKTDWRGELMILLDFLPNVLRGENGGTCSLGHVNSLYLPL